MKVEKICAVVLGLLIAAFCIVYATLPEDGEQIYIPQETAVPEGVEIPDGYHPVDNFTDVYYFFIEYHRAVFKFAAFFVHCNYMCVFD